jgi:hypothetical protein
MFKSQKLKIKNKNTRFQNPNSKNPASKNKIQISKHRLRGLNPK